MSAEHQPKHRHEQRDINFRYVGLFFVCLFLLLAASFLLMGGLFRSLAEREQALQGPPSPLAEARPEQPPEPRLQVAPRQELEELRRKEQERLKSYGWVDRSTGTIRIPIEDAMDLLAERGLPVRGETSDTERLSPE